MLTNQSFLGDLETAAAEPHSDQQCSAALRRVTDLFLAHAERFSDQQIGVFDDVFSGLIAKADASALAELSQRLAPFENAPRDIVRHLARNESIAVAGPVLAQSARLTTGDLVDVAGTRSQAHLLAISGRGRLGEFVTDALLQHGEIEVIRCVAGNAGARLSEAGFSTLIRRAEHDERLAEAVGRRPDVPLQLFRQLLLRTSSPLQSRLLAQAPPDRQTEIRRLLSLISNVAGRPATDGRDDAAAERA